jgi:hypothetical protein
MDWHSEHRLLTRLPTKALARRTPSHWIGGQQSEAEGLGMCPKSPGKQSRGQQWNSDWRESRETDR